MVPVPGEILPCIAYLLPSHASDSAQGRVSLEAGFRVSSLVREIEGSQVFQRQRFLGLKSS